MLLSKLTIIILSLFLLSCSTGARKKIDHLHHILLYNLHVRRPLSLGASPYAEKGEEEYESRPKPNSRFDCEPIKWLYREMDLQALQQCLVVSTQVKNPVFISFVLKREVAPYLELNEQTNDQPAPECMKHLVKKILVPREIFYQSAESGELACYSSDLSSLDEKMLGFSEFMFVVDLKEVVPPENEAALLMLLGTWSLMPFLTENSSEIKAKNFPAELCMKCMGEKNLFRDKKSLPPYWP